MSYIVSAAEQPELQSGETERVRSILQNVAVILSTKKGSVPLYREFGVDMSYLDKPIPVARNMLVAPVREAVERWEPRARVKDVTSREDPAVPGRLIPIVEVEIVDE